VALVGSWRSHRLNRSYTVADWQQTFWHFIISTACSTRAALAGFGIKDFSGLMPTDLFNWSNLFTLKGLIFMVLGGFLVGFGTRYADGCTSGHSIMGLSNLQLPSLIATICFMAGGFLGTQLLLPLIFKLF